MQYVNTVPVLKDSCYPFVDDSGKSFNEIDSISSGQSFTVVAVGKESIFLSSGKYSVTVNAQIFMKFFRVEG